MTKYKSKSTAMKGADKWFSRYIRNKYADFNGQVRCITCKTKKHWKDLDAGHFVSRGYRALRYDERNVFPQCKKCNMQGGESDDYALFLKEEFGDGIIKELNKAKREYKTWTKKDYEEIARIYKEKLDELS